MALCLQNNFDLSFLPFYLKAGLNSKLLCDTDNSATNMYRCNNVYGPANVSPLVELNVTTVKIAHFIKSHETSKKTI